MNDEELILLMNGARQRGKTTLVLSLCEQQLQEKIKHYIIRPTLTTVDWAFDPDATELSLVDIELNLQNFYDTDKKNSCNKLLTTFDIAPNHLSDISQETFRNEVKDLIIENYGNDIYNICQLFTNIKYKHFLHKIKIVLSPSENLRTFLAKEKISLVLRETCGCLGEQFNENQIHETTNINGTLLLTPADKLKDSSINPDVTKYIRTMNMAPVFTLLFLDKRQLDIEPTFEKSKPISLTEADIKNLVHRIQNEKLNDYVQSKFNYSFMDKNINIYASAMNIRPVYHFDTLHYVCFEDDTIRKRYNSYQSTIFDCDEYRLYQSIIFEKLKDMINKMLIHKTIMKEMNSIKDDIISKMTSSTELNAIQSWDYKIEDICNSIASGEEILGPLNGVSGNPPKLAFRCGNVAFYHLVNIINDYQFTDMKLENSSLDSLTEYQKELIKNNFLDIIFENSDIRNNIKTEPFIKREIIEQAIEKVRKNDVPTENTLALWNDVLSKIASCTLFKQKNGRKSEW